MQTKDYIRRINYYETDKMGFTHHSNYVRIMEEARIDFLGQIGCSYASLEADGVVSPVVSIGCSYKAPTTFGDEICVRVRILEYKRFSLTLGYEMKNNKTGALVFTGESRHCFTNPDGRLIALVDSHPEYHELLASNL